MLKMKHIIQIFNDLNFHFTRKRKASIQYLGFDTSNDRIRPVKREISVYLLSAAIPSFIPAIIPPRVHANMAASTLKKSNGQRWSSGLDVLRRGESNPVRYDIFHIIILNMNCNFFQ